MIWSGGAFQSCPAFPLKEISLSWRVRVGRLIEHTDLARLSSLGYETGLRVLSLIMLRNTQQAGGKVCLFLILHQSLSRVSERMRRAGAASIARLQSQDPKREHRLIPILQFVHTQIFKYCFGKPADGLERSVEGEDECTSHFLGCLSRICAKEPDRS
jgi:hypothetical protein